MMLGGVVSAGVSSSFAVDVIGLSLLSLTLVFILSLSTSPTTFPLNCLSAKAWEFMALRLDSTCPAKASWISKTPMSFIVRPMLLRTLWAP